MSLRLVPNHDTVRNTKSGLRLVANLPLDPAQHLSPDQLVELLAETPATVHPHLLVCAACAAEFDSLRDSLALFRDASNAFAAQELRPSTERILAARSSYRPWLVPAYWATAAALLIAAMIPLEVQHQHTLAAAAIAATSASARSATAETDAALLDDVDRELSASVPAPMQTLEDPVGSASNFPATSSTSAKGN